MWFLPAALLAASVAGSASALKHVSKDAAQSLVVPNHYIVELSEPAVSKRASDADPHAAGFYQALKENGIQATPKLNISSTVFNGVSFSVTSKTKLDEIAALNEVKQVWPVRRVPLPKTTVEQVGGTAMWTSHSQTGVLDLHAQGIMGQGVTVAIVDTGIDYTNPSLGGCFGPGCKVDGGTDIVGNDYDGTSDNFDPDPDPMDQQGHGTHVAGIIAASNDSNFVSVAPMANLRIYKVFSDVDETSTDALVLGFVTAFDDGADIISSSIGGAGGWQEDPWAVVSSRIVDEGVFVSISGGNSGDVGLFYGSSGSTGTDVTSVASIDTETFFAYPGDVNFPNGTTSDIAYLAPLLEPFGFNSTVPIYATSTDITTTTDACDALPSDTPDLSNMLVLIRRGTCTFEEKQDNAAAFGARYIWFYNAEDTPITYPSITDVVVDGYAMISASDGESIVSAIAAGSNITVAFPQTGSIAANNTVTGGKISSFSTWGPSNEALIKPEIAAPGGFIYSTFPVSMGSHAILSGTSMACPYVAGVAALYMSKVGGRSVLGVDGTKELRSRILTSGNFVQFNDGTATDPDHIAPVAQQGSGYINAVKVVNYATSLQPPKFELNDTANFAGSQTLTITNRGNVSLDYTLSHEIAATANTFAANFSSEIPAEFPPTLLNDAASVAFSADTITVAPGASEQVTVTFTPPALASSLLPVFGGKIVATASNGETVGAVYQGIVGNLRDQKIWDAADGTLPIVVDDLTGDEVDGPQTWSMLDGDIPAAVFFDTWATPQLRFDVVTPNWTEAEWTYPPVEGKGDFVGSVVGASDGAEFPQTYLPRLLVDEGEFFYENWNGTLTNGSVVAPGAYKFLFRALKTFGDPAVNDDWVTVLSDTQTLTFSNATNATVARRNASKTRRRAYLY